MIVKKTDWSFVFWIAAFLIGFFALGMVWWHLLIVIFLSNISVTTETRYR